MNENNQIAPVKSAYATSSFTVATIAAILTPMIPVLQKMAENYVGTLPPGSAAAVFMPGILAIVWTAFRYLTTNGERQATAMVAAAQVAAIGAQNKAPDTINAGHDANIGSTSRPPDAIPEAVENRVEMPGDVSQVLTPNVPDTPVVEPLPDAFNPDAARELQAAAVIEQEAQHGSN